MISVLDGVDKRIDRAKAVRPTETSRRMPLMRSSIALFAAVAAATLTCGGRSAAQTITISVDAHANTHAISPLIYGVAFSPTAALKDLNAPLNRSGGNSETTYNWQINAHNHANDYFFESLPDGVGSTPGAYQDDFISGSQAGGASPLITIPTLGWIANLGPGGTKLDSFSVAKYGAQTQTDPYWPDAGNGILSSTGAFVVNNPNDANVPSTTATQQGFVSHLVSTWGTAATGGVKYYLMDNEPSIWFSTHRDTHPIGPTMDEILADIENYGGMVKAQDPTAQVMGPEEWGWEGYLYDGYDQQYYSAHGTFPDYASHGNMYYIPWLLQQLAANNTATGKRILDTLSVHWYPQGGEDSNDVTAATELLRNESTRSLWDPSYTDQSWIDAPVYLIPRLKGWVSTYYPGTKTAITEYNWGAESFINGATTQADVYGIFGQQNLDMATRWTTPATGTPVYNAMKMYRNYDGADSTFGDTSVSATVPNADNVSSFAALRSSDNALTIMVINKQLTTAQAISLGVANFSGNGTAHAWQLTSANVLQQIADVPVVAGAISTTLPAQSITLFVLPAAGTPITIPAAPTGLMAGSGSGYVSLAWTGSAGATSYNVLRSTSASGTFTTVGSTTAAAHTDSTAVNGTTYYYAVAAVNSAGTGPKSSVVSATPAAADADASPYNFETSTQTWASSGGMITGMQTSVTHAFLGASSLAVQFNASGADNQNVSVLSPSVPAGATVTYHVWVPAASGITYVDPFVLQGAAGNWLWTDNTTPIASLTPNAWNTLTVTLPANAAALNSLGVQFGTSGAWSGTCYVDSISWSFVVPATPTGLAARAGNAAVALAWNASTGAATYSVLRSTSASGPFASVTSTASNSYLDQPLTNGVTYYYEVKAVNTGGTSGPSSIVSATPSASDSNSDTSYYNFETSSQGWAGSGGMISGVQTSVAQAFLGLSSLAVEFAGSAADSQTVSISSPPTPAGATVTFHIWIPSGSAISGIQPYVLQDAAGGWTWTGAWTDISQLQTNAWNTITVTVPANASPLYSLGVQFNTSGAWTGDCYVDSVNWTGAGGTTPAAPAGLTATKGNAQVTLAWSASTGATSYNVYRGTTAGSESASPIATGITATTTYTDSGLTNGTTYYYKVTAINAAGTSPQSNEASATPTGPAPSAPAGLLATAGNAQVILTWTTSAGATSYAIYRGTASRGESRSPIATGVSVTSYTNTGLVNGTAYYYTVAAVSVNGTSGQSAEAHATPVGASTPSPPSSLTATAGNTQVALAWTASSGATSYNVYRGTTAGGEAATAISTGISSTTFTNTGLTNGTAYFYKMAAVNASGTSAESTEASATPQVPAPPAPTGLTATAGNTQITLSWTVSASATSYNVYRGTTAGGELATAIATGVAATTFTNTGLTNGATYFYKVAAVNAGGTSAMSGESSATPAGVPTSPTGLAAAAGNGMVTLSWTASSGATSYNVYRGTATGGESATAIAAGVTPNTFTDTGLTNGTAYFYKVAAVNPAGTSTQSNEASATPSASALPVPGGVTATGGDQSVTVSWSASAGATSYNVYELVSGSYRLAANTTALTYTVTRLTNGAAYTFEVAGAASGKASANSGPVTATPSAVAITAGPSVAVSGTTATITWTTNLLSQSTVNYGTTTSLGTTVSSATLTTSHSVALTGLTVGTTYDFKVSSTDGTTTAASALSTFKP